MIWKHLLAPPGFTNRAKTKKNIFCYFFVFFVFFRFFRLFCFFRGCLFFGFGDFFFNFPYILGQFFGVGNLIFLFYFLVFYCFLFFCCFFWFFVFFGLVWFFSVFLVKLDIREGA